MSSPRRPCATPRMAGASCARLRDLPGRDRAAFRQARGRNSPRSASSPASTGPTASSATWRRLAGTDRPAPSSRGHRHHLRSAASRCRIFAADPQARPRRSSRSAGQRRASEAAKDRSFYAVGGTWRSLARLHMSQPGYPLHVMHGYTMPAQGRVRLLPPGPPGRHRDAVGMEVVSVRGGRCSPMPRRRAGDHRRAQAEGRRDLGAGRARGPALFAARPSERRRDPLLAAARELNLLRSRSPRHGEELSAWSDRFMGRPVSTRPRRRSGCAMRPAFWPISAGGRTPTIAASSPSTSSPTPPLSDRSSWPRLYGAGDILSAMSA